MGNRFRDLFLVLGLVALGAYFLRPAPQPQATPTPEILSATPQIMATEMPSGPEPSDAPYVNTRSGLRYQILKKGSGPTVQAKDRPSVHYAGWLGNGTQIDSSLDRHEPFVFDLGVGQVIRGWDEGVVGMRVGEKRRLTIPPELGYGDQGAGGIVPPKATLIFDVELLTIKKAGK